MTTSAENDRVEQAAVKIGDALRGAEDAEFVAAHYAEECRLAWGEVMEHRLLGRHKAAALRLIEWLGMTEYDNPRGDEILRVLRAGLLQGDVVR
jgi:hypothetical protein